MTIPVTFIFILTNPSLSQGADSCFDLFSVETGRFSNAQIIASKNEIGNFLITKGIDYVEDPNLDAFVI
jgi:hypothetical protein